MNTYYKDILKIALPSIVSNITVPLLGLVDVGITGHLGSAVYLGAIAVGGMLFNIIYWMFAFLRMGTSGMTAQAYGRNDNAEIVTMLARSLGIALAIGVALICLTPAVREASLYFINPSLEVADMARCYFNICILGVPAGLGLFALNGWFVGMQNSRIPMFVAIFQNLFNIVVSFVLVYVFSMKVEGIAIGTMSAQWGGFLIAVALLYYKYGDLLRNANVKGIWSKGELIRFFSVNRDIFFRTLCLISIHFFFISAGARLGDMELAVNTVLMQFFTLYSYIMDGFAFAGEALVGKAMGAGNRNDYTQVVKRLFIFGFLMVCLFTITYGIFGDDIIMLLTSDKNVIESAMQYEPWIFLFPVCGMAAFVWDGVYIGATATRNMLQSTFAGMVVFFSLYYVFFPSLHNHGLWIAYVGNLLARGLVLTFTRRKISDALTTSFQVADQK